MVEQSLVFIKPDAVKRGLVDEVVSRIKTAGFNIVNQKKLTMSSDLSDQHYQEHVDKPFYPSLKKFITSGPIVAMIVEGENAISGIRTLAGATDPAKADPGTVRADLGTSMTENVMHASDGLDSAKREIQLFFS